MLSIFPHTAVITAPPRSGSLDFPNLVSIRVNAQRCFFSILSQHCNISFWSRESTCHDPDAAVSSGRYVIGDHGPVLLHPGISQPRILKILLGDIVFGDKYSASTVLRAVGEAGANTNSLGVWVAESIAEAMLAYPE